MAVRHEQREPEIRLVLDKLSDDVLLDDAPLGQLSREGPATIKRGRREQAQMNAPAPIAMPWRAWAKNNSLGVNFTWRAISAGRLKVRRIGKRMLILDEDGRAFLRQLPEGRAATPANLKRPRRSAEAEAKSGVAV
jgi:hypothetical protein